MSGGVAQLPEIGSHLCDLRLTRLADGSIVADVIRMHPRLIETTGEETPQRLCIIAGWTIEAAGSLTRQAMQLQIESISHG